MTLDRLISVTVTKQTRFPTQQGFGTLMLATSHAVAGPDVQTFASLGEAEDAGFTAAAEPFNNRLLSVAFGQEKSPTRVKVGRRNNVSAQTVEIVPLSLIAGVVYTLAVNGESGTFTVQSGDALADVCDDITTLVNGLTGAGADVTATDGGTKVTVAAGTAAKRFYVTGLDWCSVDDITTDGGIATDLAAIAAEDPDFYGLIIDGSGPLEIAGAATWAGANTAIFVPDSADSDCKDNGSSADILSTLKASAHARTGGIFSRGDYCNGRAIGWMAGKLVDDPMATGSTRKRTWAHYTINSVPAYSLTEGEKDTIEAKYGTHFTTYAGLNLTHDGHTASGEFLDIPQFTDAFTARLQEAIVRLFATTDMRFDGETQAAIEGTIWSIVQQGQDAKAIALDPDPRVYVPAPLDVPVADRGNRTWTGITIDIRYTGGVHSADVHVNLTV